MSIRVAKNAPRREKRLSSSDPSAHGKRGEREEKGRVRSTDSHQKSWDSLGTEDDCEAHFKYFSKIIWYQLHVNVPHHFHSKSLYFLST